MAKTCLLIKDGKVWEKYERIWDVIKKKPGIKFHSEPIYEKRYLKAKVRGVDWVIKTNKFRVRFRVRIRFRVKI